jgi:hypothetical protein
MPSVMTKLTNRSIAFLLCIVFFVVSFISLIGSSESTSVSTERLKERMWAGLMLKFMMFVPVLFGLSPTMLLPNLNLKSTSMVYFPCLFFALFVVPRVWYVIIPAMLGRWVDVMSLYSGISRPTYREVLKRHATDVVLINNQTSAEMVESLKKLDEMLFQDVDKELQLSGLQIIFARGIPQLEEQKKTCEQMLHFTNSSHVCIVFLRICQILFMLNNYYAGAIEQELSNLADISSYVRHCKPLISAYARIQSRSSTSVPMSKVRNNAMSFFPTCTKNTIPFIPLFSFIFSNHHFTFL